MGATLNVIERLKYGNGWAVIADITLDNSYAAGGEAVVSPLEVIREVFFPDSGSYQFEYDKVNDKIKAFSPRLNAAQPPALIVEEAVVVAAGVGTLKHKPLYIVAVQPTAGTVTGAFSVIPVGETPLTKQVAVNFATGGLTFKATDAVTAAKITYMPKRSTGYLSSVTVDEVVTASASKVNLGARAGLIQYVWDDTDGVLVNLEQPGTSPSATHFCTVDILDTADTSIDSHADDATNKLKVTYVPYSQIPPGCFIDDADITLNSEAWNFTGDPLTAGYNHLVVPGFGVMLIGETGDAARAAAILEGPSGTAADAIATWNPATNSILTNQTTAATILSMPWLILDPNQLSPITPVEVPATTDLSAVTTRAMFIGY